MKRPVKGTVKKITENSVIILLLPNFVYILVSVRLFLKEITTSARTLNGSKLTKKYVFIFVFQINTVLLNCIFFNES